MCFPLQPNVHPQNYYTWNSQNLEIDKDTCIFIIAKRGNLYNIIASFSYLHVPFYFLPHLRAAPVIPETNLHAFAIVETLHRRITHGGGSKWRMKPIGYNDRKEYFAAFV